MKTILPKKLETRTVLLPKRYSGNMADLTEFVKTEAFKCPQNRPDEMPATLTLPK